MLILTMVSVTLFGKRIFAAIITDLKMRSSRVTHVGPPSEGKSPYKTTEGCTGRPSEDRSRDWSYVAAQSKDIIDRMQFLENNCDFSSAADILKSMCDL